MFRTQNNFRHGGSGGYTIYINFLSLKLRCMHAHTSLCCKVVQLFSTALVQYCISYCRYCLLFAEYGILYRGHCRIRKTVFSRELSFSGHLMPRIQSPSNCFKRLELISQFKLYCQSHRDSKHWAHIIQLFLSHCVKMSRCWCPDG